MPLSAILSAMPNYIDTKYINLISPRLHKFGWKKQNLAACRCPVCGDSQKSKTKTRFYFYEKKGGFFVRCHNCDYGTTLGKFIEYIDPYVYKQYMLEKYRDGLEGRNESKTETEQNFKFESPVFETKRRELLLESLECLTELPEDHKAVEFVRRRKIPVEKWNRLYFTEDFGWWAKQVDPEIEAPPDERLVIPIMRGKRLVAAQGRSLSPTASGRNIRYITIKRDKELQSIWFGLDHVNKAKTVVIVEGPLDSLFLDNGVAMLGAKHISELPSELKECKLVFALDNEPRNKEVVGIYQKLVENGHRVCFWPETIRVKDINDMVLAGHEPSEIEKIIEENSAEGLLARLKLSTWRHI
jgi:hypothetical protein